MYHHFSEDVSPPTCFFMALILNTTRLYQFHDSSGISQIFTINPSEVIVLMKSMATFPEKLQKSWPGVAKRAGRRRRQVPPCGTSWRGGDLGVETDNFFSP